MSFPYKWWVWGRPVRKHLPCKRLSCLLQAVYQEAKGNTQEGPSQEYYWHIHKVDLEGVSQRCRCLFCSFSLKMEPGVLQISLFSGGRSSQPELCYWLVSGEVYGSCQKQSDHFMTMTKKQAAKKMMKLQKECSWHLFNMGNRHRVHNNSSYLPLSKASTYGPKPPSVTDPHWTWTWAPAHMFSRCMCVLWGLSWTRMLYFFGGYLLSWG